MDCVKWMVEITGKICVFKRTIVVEMDAGIYSWKFCYGCTLKEVGRILIIVQQWLKQIV